MKIMKVFGIVVGIHVFALILIFANPGCSSTTKPAPQPADTVAPSEPAPMITMPVTGGAAAPSGYADAGGALTPTSVGTAPNAPASYADGPGVRFTPTRPNTPAASAVLAHPVDNVTPVTTYTVKSGDNLWTLQKKFHVNYKEIAAANNIKTSSPLHQGQKLIIPGKPAAAAKSGTVASAGPSTTASASATRESAKPAGGEVTYTVKPGDTIEGIAKRFEVKWQDLAVHNSVDNPLRLRPGTVLSIPGWKSPSAGRSPAQASRETAKPAPAPQPAAEPKPAAPPVIEMESTPEPSSNVPVIHIDENPVTPAPTPKK